jgi:hypothetical protein
VEALALYRARLDAYREADHRVDVGSEETPEEVAARVALWLQDAGVRAAAGRRVEEPR